MRLKHCAAVFASLLAVFTGIASGNDAYPPGVEEKTGFIVPRDLTFSDEKGNEVSLDRFTDKPAIVSLVYLSCAGVCPALLGTLAQTLEKTGYDAKDYRVITLSFDDRDTPALAFEKKKNYLMAAGPSFPESSWSFLTGSRENIQKFTRAVGFGFREEKGGFSHPRVLVFLSRGGTIVRYLYGPAFTPFDVKMALTEAAMRHAGIGVGDLDLFCYGYDKAEKKYVFNTVRVAGAAMSVVAASLFAVLLLSSGTGGRKA